MSVPGPVFVAGPSRSGTALVRSLLNGHPEVHLANETHYFDDLRRRIDPDARLVEGADREVVDYFRAITHRPYGHFGEPELGWLGPDELRARAQSLGGRPDHYFRAFCELSAAREGGPGVTVWGEKTPRHIFRVDDIMAAFPEARVVAMVRDPRAVVASYKKWRNQGGLPGSDDVAHEEKLAAETLRARRSYHPVVLALLWRGQANAAAAARRRHGPERVRIQRYEDLVERPEAAARGLAAFVGLDFTPEMLEVPMHNSSFSTFQEGKGVSAEAIGRWREVLDPGELAAVQRVTARQMADNGYDALPVRGGIAAAARPWLTFPVAAVRAARANGARGGGLAGYVLRRAKAVVSG